MWYIPISSWRTRYTIYNIISSLKLYIIFYRTLSYTLHTSKQLTNREKKMKTFCLIQYERNRLIFFFLLLYIGR